jgi:hypothetical protein
MSGEAWLVGAAIASPILSFAGGSVGSRIAGRADNRLDVWRRREEVMRTVRWAADNATDVDPRVSEVGFAALQGVEDSEMLQHEDLNFVRIVTAAALALRVQRLPVSVDTDEDEG